MEEDRGMRILVKRGVKCARVSLPCSAFQNAHAPVRILSARPHQLILQLDLERVELRRALLPTGGCDSPLQEEDAPVGAFLAGLAVAERGDAAHRGAVAAGALGEDGSGRARQGQGERLWVIPSWDRGRWRGEGGGSDCRRDGCDRRVWDRGGRGHDAAASAGPPPHTLGALCGGSASLNRPVAVCRVIRAPAVTDDMDK